MDKQLSKSFDLERKVLSSGELQLSELSGVAGEVEAFKLWSSFQSIPFEIVEIKAGEMDYLPCSVYGQTQVRYVGEEPMISLEPDQNGNLKMLFTGVGAVEVIFNSIKVKAHGRNRGAHGRKKIYIVKEK